jgi:hypothetical protein
MVAAGIPQPVMVAGMVGTKSRHRARLLLATVAAVSMAVAIWWGLRNHGGNPEIVLAAVPLTTDPGNELCASLSPDGTQVVFESDRDGGRSHIYIKVVGPGDSLRLTSGSAAEYGPAWSPDERSIAFIRRLDPFRVGVILIPALGGAERKLTEFASAAELLARRLPVARLDPRLRKSDCQRR